MRVDFVKQSASFVFPWLRYVQPLVFSACLDDRVEGHPRRTPSRSSSTLMTISKRPGVPQVLHISSLESFLETLDCSIQRGRSICPDNRVLFSWIMWVHCWCLHCRKSSNTSHNATSATDKKTPPSPHVMLLTNSLVRTGVQVLSDARLGGVAFDRGHPRVSSQREPWMPSG